MERINVEGIQDPHYNLLAKYRTGQHDPDQLVHRFRSKGLQAWAPQRGRPTVIVELPIVPEESRPEALFYRIPSELKRGGKLKPEVEIVANFSESGGNFSRDPRENAAHVVASETGARFRPVRIAKNIAVFAAPQAIMVSMRPGLHTIRTIVSDHNHDFGILKVRKLDSHDRAFFAEAAKLVHAFEACHDKLNCLECSHVHFAEEAVMTNPLQAESLTA